MKVTLFSTVMGLAMAGTAVAQGTMRESGGFYTPERLENIRNNVETYAWAEAARSRAASSAERWVNLSDEALWSMVPCQSLPRCIDVTMTYVKSGKVRPGCLVCGDDVFKHGNYPYRPDIFGKPWKLTCPSCGSVFPTNDFGAYYRSGIDEHGCFDPEKADRSLLFNQEHADKDDPLHTWGVDDGFGYTDKNGLDHRYIAYYAWKLWDEIQSGVRVLSEAYVLTGEPVYARKCAILLDRIADVYPAMDWNEYARRGWYHSDGGSKRGKIEGRIWETGVLRNFATSYDRIITGLDNQPELYGFLAQKAEQFDLPTPKGNRTQLMQNVDDNILRCGADAVRDHQIHGNEGMHQLAMAACAVALNSEPDTTAMLDWIFAEDGGHIPAVVVGGIDRDGVGAEAAPGYALSWGGNIGQLADLLAQYAPYTKNDIYRDYPQFAKTFTAGTRITILDYDTPSIGDAGATGTIGKVQCDPGFIVRGYRFLRDEEIALAAYRENDYSAEGLGGNIMDADPNRIVREIEAIAAQHADQAAGLGPHHMAGYGFLTLEQGRAKHGTGTFLYYGRNAGHGHLDRLNIGLYGFGFDLTPDLGYPEFATSWPKRNEWTRQTIAHNTVVVDQKPQTQNWVGHPRFFKVLPRIQCAEIESLDVYPTTTDYRRTLLFVPLSDTTGYLVDIFRVAGGNDHIRSFHGPGTELVTHGLSLEKQEKGTYAGVDIPFGTTLPAGPGYGFSWLTNVERAESPGNGWYVDWAVPSGYRGAKEDDDIHVRAWDVSSPDSVALANGEPPQNKPGNPRWLRYCLTRRRGENLTSTFASVIEPYQGTPTIQAVERLDLPDASAQNGPLALRISLANGTTHLVLYNPDLEQTLRRGNLSLDGRLGFAEIDQNGQTKTAAMIMGTNLQINDMQVSSATDAWRGTVTRREQTDDGLAVIHVDTKLPDNNTLVGQEIIIENDRRRNACYTIEAVRNHGNGAEISLGRVSLVRDYIDRNDYDKGFVYNFEPGARFTIPNHAYVDMQ